MSADTAAPGGDAAKLPTRFVHHFDNHGIWGLLALLLVVTVLGSLGVTDGFDPVFWVTMAVMTPYMIALFAARRRHQPGLCGHCFDAFPLNPGEYAATRARFALRITHLVTETIAVLIGFLERHLRYKILALVAYGAVLLAVMWPLGMLLDEWFATVFLTAMTLLAYAIAQHRKLQIWCPWCDHRRGDDDRPEVEPGPEPADGIKPEEVHT